MSIGNKNKSDLNLYCQKSRIPIATYTSSMQDGLFESKVCVNGTDYKSTSGYSTKKEAENDAAGVALIAILQKEFGGKSIEEALAILEQKHPSKSKKKTKQAPSNVVQSETQLHSNSEHSKAQTDAISVTSGQIGGNTAQQGGVARTQMPPRQQKPLVESSMVQNQSQIHSGSPQSVIVRPTQTQSGAMIGQYQAAHSHQQTVVRPNIPGTMQQSATMGQTSRQQHQQAMVRPNQAYIGSHTQQAMVQGRDIPTDRDVAWSQGAVMTLKGGGGAREQVQRMPGQPSAPSADIHPTSYSTGSRGQAPPTQGYAPPIGSYYYQVQGYPPTNTAAYGQNYAPPYMQPSYMYQAPPTGGNQWPHPQPHPPHPRLINSNPPGAYPPSGPQTVMPTGAQIRVAPPSGARSMAARFPGAAPPSSQQLCPILSSSRPPPPPPGFSADQSAASLPQTAPNKPLNAIPVTQLTGQGLPCGAAGNVKQDVESASQKDGSKILDFGHTKQLEDLCKTRNLPPPQYKINQDKGKFIAEVRIGGQSFRTQWPCEYFEQAKSIAAMEAMASLALSMSTLSTSDTGNQQQSESSRSSTASSSQAEANPSNSKSATPPNQTAKGQSSTAHTQQDSASKHQQTISSGQQSIVSPSNTTTTNNPPPALQPPSFFTNSPNPPSNTTAATSTQVQPKPVRQEIQPPASSKPKAMAVNYKQILNTHSQRNHIPLVYDCVAAEEAVGYIATVKVSGKVYTSKPHGTKRAAETDAATEAVKALGLVGPHGEYQPQGKAGHGYGGLTQTSSASQPQSAGMVSYKNLLQEHMQKQGLTLPHYETERVEEGFKSTVKVHCQGNESKTFTSSPQPVKKGAEQEAAKAACLELKLVH